MLDHIVNAEQKKHKIGTGGSYLNSTRYKKQRRKFVVLTSHKCWPPNGRHQFDTACGQQRASPVPFLLAVFSTLPGNNMHLDNDWKSRFYSAYTQQPSSRTQGRICIRLLPRDLAESSTLHALVQTGSSWFEGQPGSCSALSRPLPQLRSAAKGRARSPAR